MKNVNTWNRFDLFRSYPTKTGQMTLTRICCFNGVLSTLLYIQVTDVRAQKEISFLFEMIIYKIPGNFTMKNVNKWNRFIYFGHMPQKWVKMALIRICCFNGVLSTLLYIQVSGVRAQVN